MVDSPHHAYNQVKFTISEKGVEDAKETQRNFTNASETFKILSYYIEMEK